MELNHGRRGNSVACGMNRGNLTLLLMLAMVVSMAFVLVWEAVPFARSGGSLTPILAEPGRDHEELELRIQSFESRPLSKSPLLENTEKDATDVDDEKREGDYQSVNHDRLGRNSAPEAGISAAPALDFVDEQRFKDVPEVEKEQDTESNIRGSETTNSTNADHQKDGMSRTRDVGEMSFSEKVNETDSRANAREAVAPFETNESLTTVPEPEENASMLDSSGLDEHNATMHAGEESLTEHQAELHPLADDSEGAVTPFSDETTVVESADDEDSKVVCDYSIGDWVLDKTRPLYSGKECSLWLSPDWACRRHNHPDKNMDRYRWQPKGCDLPTFNASAALETLRNKVVAFVGDSLGRQQYQSLLCMLTRGKNHSLTDVGSAFRFYTPRGARKPTGYAHRFDSTNTTIVFRWTVTLARVQQLEDSNVALHLDRPEEFLEEHLGKIHVLVVNSGHHWNRGKMEQNRFQFHHGGEAVPQEAVSVAYNRTVHNVVKWLHSHMQKRNQVIYYRSLSPRHFRNGDWNTGGTCDQNGKQVQEGLRVDKNAESAVAETNVRLLNVTSLSLLRGETHVSKYGGRKGGQDCLHWCLPGVPDTWNEIMLAEIGGKFTPRSKNQTFMP